MTNLSPLLARNEEFATSGEHAGLTPLPNHQVIVVTCMDGRVDPAHVLGVGLGDALVIRNAGGRVSDDVLTEVAFVGQVMGQMFGDDAPTFEVAVIHHTSCGSAFLARPEFRSALSQASDADEEHLAAQAVVDPHETVRADCARLLGWEHLPARAAVSGHVYDVETGLVTTVVAVSASGQL